MKIVIASKSPRRKELMEKFGYSIIVDPSHANEDSIQNTDVRELTKELAKLKAETVAGKYKDAIIIGIDTLVYHEGEQIGQQKTKEEAYNTIKKLMGKKHSIYSGVYIINTANGKTASGSEKSNIVLKTVSEKELKKYINTEIWKGKAGAYDTADPEFANFILDIEGCEYNIRGLPIMKIRELLENVK